jgi:hypothetical protein
MTMGRLRDIAWLAARAIVDADRRLIDARSEDSIEAAWAKRNVAIRQLRLAMDEINRRERGERGHVT